MIPTIRQASTTPSAWRSAAFAVPSLASPDASGRVMTHMEARMPASKSGEHPFEDPWPPFLDLMDRDADQAQRDLWHFICAALRAKKPRAYSGLSEEEQEMLRSDVFLKLAKDGCRCLRSYANQGKPFYAFLATVTTSVSLDYIRRRGHGQDPRRAGSPRAARPLHRSRDRVSPGSCDPQVDPARPEAGRDSRSSQGTGAGRKGCLGPHPSVQEKATRPSGRGRFLMSTSRSSIRVRQAPDFDSVRGG